MVDAIEFFFHEKLNFHSFIWTHHRNNENSTFHMNHLSRREREIMEIVFELEEATLSDLLERVKNPPTRPALRSILSILEEKGHLCQSGKRGREFIFKATTSRKGAGKNAMARLLDTFFSGSLGNALASHLDDPKTTYTEEELAELAALIEAKRNNTKS